MAQSRPCSHPPASLSVLQNALAIVLQSSILQSTTLPSSILQSGNLPFWDLAVMRSCNNKCLQSRSKILVPLVSSCSRVTVQTLQLSQQPVLQSSKWACNCLAVPNLAVINLAVRKPAVLQSRLQLSCSPQSCSHQPCSEETFPFGILQS